MTSEPLALPDVVLLVGLVNPGGRSRWAWGTKARIILALATYVDGEWFNAPDVERLTGVPRNHARELLAELEEQRVITRAGVAADGRSKVFWCEVNPDWRRWEVEWSMEPRDIELRLAFHREVRVRQPIDRLFSRRLAPRLHSVIAVLRHRDNERQTGLPGPFSRYLGTAISEPGSRSLAPRKRGVRAKEVALLQPEDAPTPSSLELEAAAQEEEGRQHPGWAKVRHAYCSKVGVRVVYGAPATALAVLVGRHGDQAVLAAIDQAPDELGVQLLAQHLEELITLGPPPPPEPSPPPERWIPPEPPTDEERESVLEAIRATRGRGWQDEPSDSGQEVSA
jgi:hypothetical protein